MGDIKLFRIAGQTTQELSGAAVELEKSLQTLLERNLDHLLGVTFLATEFPTSNGGRMDTLGIDENGCPVIIEYKRSANENVVNQGLFYLDWLMDHRGDFKLLVLGKLGQEAAEEIEWSAPRLICIAGDFTRYDEHAVKQMQRNIELIRYRRFDKELLLLDLLTATSAASTASGSPSAAGGTYKTVSAYKADADAKLLDIYEGLRAFLLALGDDVQEKTLKFYIAFRRIKNFACVEFKVQSNTLRVFVKVDPDSIMIEPGFTRDVRKVGHFGTGDLEINVATMEDLARAKPLLIRSYESS